MKSHPQLQPWMTFHRCRDFQRTLHRRLWIGEKSQRHSIARRETDQFAGRVRDSELLGASNDLIEFVQ
jgi:hypothetical protein